MKKHRVRRWLLAALFAQAIPTLLALDWPLQESRVETTFGTPENGYFLPGIRLTSRTNTVNIAGIGEIAFRQEYGNPSTSMPLSLGTMIAVVHPDGMETVYACLEGLSTADRKSNLNAKAKIGTTGDTGWSQRRGLYFGVYDRHSSQWVNPLLILPLRKQGFAPAILSVALVDSAGETILGMVQQIRQGSYTVSASIRDQSGGRPEMGQNAPYEIMLTVDGKEIATKTFDLLWWKDGIRKLFSPGKISRAEALDMSGRYRLADVFLPRGKVSIGINVTNAAGQSRKAEWTVDVR